MDQIALKAPAKINLSLAITGKRADGYHLLRSVMQSVTLYDSVRISKTADQKITIICDKAEIPCDRSNIVYKAAEAFFSYTGLPISGLAIQLEKRIPSQAGLGGGSADGSAVILGLNKLFETGLGTAELCRIGETVGADVPFCLIGGTALAEGIGEQLTPVSPLPNCYMIIAKPPVGSSTVEAYRKYDEATWQYTDHTDALLNSLAKQDLKEASGYLFNLFEQLVPLPEVQTIKTLLLQNGGLQAVMSGSGSAVYGIFDNKEKAEKAFAVCQKEYQEVFFCVPCSEGITEEPNKP